MRTVREVVIPGRGGRSHYDLNNGNTGQIFEEVHEKRVLLIRSRYL